VGATGFGTMRQNFQAVLDRAGHGKRIVGLPARPAIALLRLLEGVHLSPLYKWIYETASKDSFVSVDRIATRLGFVPKYTTREALVRNYDWYVAHRDEISRLFGTSHRTVWKKGALEIAKWLF
jgi:nucleoside-diphosphate-sugar epimerase